VWHICLGVELPSCLPRRRPYLRGDSLSSRAKREKWWDAIVAAPSDEEPVSDIVDHEESKRLTEQLNRVIESVFCPDDAKKLTGILLDWAKHTDHKQVKDTLRPLLRKCDRDGDTRYLRKVLLNFFLALPDPWRKRASSILSALTVKTSG
jgi:hypothetical protein